MNCNNCDKFIDCQLRSNRRLADGTFGVTECPEKGQLEWPEYKKRKVGSSLKKFLFGKGASSYTSGCIVISAFSLDQAILEFKASEHSPERFVSPDCYKKDENGHLIYRNNGQTTSYECPYELTENPYIVVAEKIESDNRNWEDKEVCRLLLSECVSVDYKNFNRVSGLLESSAQGKGIENAKEDTSKNELEIKSPSSIATSGFDNKSEIISKRNELARQKNRLELEARKLQEMISALNEEISSKKKILKGILIYNGVDCECYHLLEGQKAPEGTKLSLYQEKLYCDVETSVWTCRYGWRSFDYNNMDEFEDFIKLNFKNYHYRPLSVIAWQIRRTEKDYKDAFETMRMNYFNFLTVITIRNGENLYILYPSFKVEATMFPKTGDVEAIYKSMEEVTWTNKPLDERLKEHYEKYAFCLLFLQGLVDRTDLLNNSIKGVNLIKGDSEKIEFIRDAEKQFWIDDGHRSFHEFLEENRNSIEIGSRVLYWGSNEYNCNVKNQIDECMSRTGMRWVDFPSSNEFYIVNKTGKRWSHYGSDRTFFQFSYLPKQEISWYQAQKRDGDYERTRRIAFKAYPEELINIDTIDEEEVDYFLSNRKYRSQYESMLPVLTTAMNFLRKEKKQEEEFKKLIKTQLSFEPSEEQLSEAIANFKTKKFGTSDERKWKRGLLNFKDNGDTAVRQIVKTLEKQNKEKNK